MNAQSTQTAAEQADYHAFMVRIWRGPAGWQGEIYSLQEAGTLPFAGLPDLLLRLETCLAGRETPSQTSANV